MKAYIKLKTVHVTGLLYGMDINRYTLDSHRLL
jgi:hypothetical protein